MLKTKEQLAKERKAQNDYVLKRMKNPNDQLAAYSSTLYTTPKPKIIKDKEALKQLYGE